MYKRQNNEHGRELY